MNLISSTLLLFSARLSALENGSKGPEQQLHVSAPGELRPDVGVHHLGAAGGDVPVTALLEGGGVAPVGSLQALGHRDHREATRRQVLLTDLLQSLHLELVVVVVWTGCGRLG